MNPFRRKPLVEIHFRGHIHPFDVQQLLLDPPTIPRKGDAVQFTWQVNKTTSRRLSGVVVEVEHRYWSRSRTSGVAIQVYLEDLTYVDCPLLEKQRCG